MKKQGFTLQELLISLAIVGVVAAMTAPAMMKIMPDETKVRYMKAYNALTGITSDLLSDNTIYWIEGYNDDGSPSCVGLDCKSGNSSNDFKVLKDAHPEFVAIANKILPGLEAGTADDYDLRDFNRWKSNSSTKYPIFLASRMNLQSDITYNEDTHSCEFTTTDGTKWIITPDNSYTVEIDVNPSNNESIAITDENVDADKVDMFTFNVSNTGSVSPADSLGQAFLKTPTDMHRKKEDRALAQK